MFDSKGRAKRSAKRTLATIPEPGEAARGASRIRGFFKVDHSKIMTGLKRLGKGKHLGDDNAK